MANTLSTWLSQGPFTLAMSSSFFGFYSHCAVAAALYERGFKPQKTSGTSAGALVAGALASGFSPQDLRELMFGMQRKDFWDPRPGLGILRGRKFLNILEAHFAPTFDKTRMPVEVGVFDLFSMKTRFLRDGSLPHAVAASCAVPVMFHPKRIGWRFYYDGGIFNKAGINYQNREERVLNVFLDSVGFRSTEENEATLKRRTQNHRVLRFQKFPRIDINALETGRTAYEDVYRRMQKVFDLPFDQGILNA